MNYQHKSLAAGRWRDFSLMEQLANVGSEVMRAINWAPKNSEYSGRALERALELIGLTMADPKNIKRLKEITRMKEALLDYFLAENSFNSSDLLWEKYFSAFSWAARLNK